jgi:hypothetical protein
MALASFRINQPAGVGYSYWDRARRDISAGVVECEAQNKSESSYLWEIISAPPGETITVINPTSHTCEFTLSTSYGYLVRLTVNAGEIDEQKKTLYLGISLVNSGANLPAMNETNQDNSQSPYNGARGYEEKINEALTLFDGGYSWEYDDPGVFLYPLNINSGVKIGSKSAADPSYSFYSDQDTGMYLAGDGMLGFSAAGIEMYRSYYDSGSPVLEASHDSFSFKNARSATATPISVSVLSQATGSCTGADLYLQSSGDTTQTVGAEVSAKAPGGTTALVLQADTTGTAGGTSGVTLKASGAGTPTLSISAETTGVLTSTVSVLSQSDGAAADLIISASANSSYAATVSVGASGSSSSTTTIGGDSLLIFTDQYKGSSTYTDPLRLATSSTFWSNFVTRFGNGATLLGAIYTAGSQTLQSAHDNGNTINGTIVLAVPSSTGGYGLSIDCNDTTSDGALEVSVAGGDVPWFVGRYNTSEALRIGFEYDDGIHISPGVDASRGNNHIMFTTLSNYPRDHDRGNADDTVHVFIYGSTSVDTDNTQYMYFMYDSTVPAAVINTGSGYIKLGTTATPDFASAQGDVYIDGSLEVGTQVISDIYKLYNGTTQIAQLDNNLNDGLHLAAQHRNVFAFVKYDYVGQTHGISTIYNSPALYIFGNSDPSVDNDIYARLYIDGSSDLNIRVQTGDYLHLDSTGLWADTASLFEDDVEIDSTLTIKVSSSLTEYLNFMYLTGTMSTMSTYTDDGFHWAFSNSINYNLILTTVDNSSKDHDRLDTMSSPSIYLFSQTDPDTDNTQWLQLHRDLTYAEINVGSGYLRFDGGPVLTAGGSSYFGSTEETTLSVVSNDVTINFNENNFFYVSFAGAISSWTITNPISPGWFKIRFFTGGSGTIDFPAAWWWNGSAPPFSMSPGNRRILDVYYDGFSYYGTMSAVFTT